MFNFVKSTKTKEKKPPFSQRVGAFDEKPRFEYLLPWAYVSAQTGVVYGKDNSLMAVFTFRGPDMASSTPEELVQYNAALNNVFKALPTGYVLYFEAQRHFSDAYEASEIDVPLVQVMENERRDYYKSQQHFESTYYFIVYYEPPQLLKRKLTDAFIKDAKNKGENSEQDLRLVEETTEKFINNVNLIGSMLSHLFPDIKALDADETLTYLHSTVSNRRVEVKNNPLRYICDYIFDESGFTAGREPKLGDKHMRVVTILNFPPMSSPGVFDALNNLNMEYRWVSRFICMSQQDAKKELKNYKTLWSQQVLNPLAIARKAVTKEAPTENDSDEAAIINKDDLTVALAELSEDLVAYGYYTMTVIVKDDDAKKCNEKANQILDVINSMGYTGYIEKDNSTEAWWGSLPGCYRANIRRPIINSLNFCHLAPITATWSGDKRNEYLKGPVLLYTDTDGNSAFRLSLHVGDVGHTMICGPSGSGKSVLLNTIEAHFLKYPGSRVFIFDKAASSRALTLGVGGNFYNLAAESSELSFQPLAAINDDNEIRWAREWILSYLAQRNITVTPAYDNFVWKALNSLKSMPERQRTISTFCELVQSREIRVALQPLTVKGSYGKLFDNSNDVYGSGRWQVFEMETLMATPAIVPPTLDYLFHRIEGSLKEASGPAIIVLDECWLFFDNPVFKDKLREYFKDMRKKNTSIIFATQNLADVANKPELLTTVMENCPNRIFLPNVNAANKQSSELYRLFGCNDTQIRIIADMMPKRDYYYNSQKGNRVFRLALRPAELPFVTATSKSDQLAMDKLLAEYSQENFVEQWLKYKGCDKEWDEIRWLWFREVLSLKDCGKEIKQ